MSILITRLFTAFTVSALLSFQTSLETEDKKERLVTVVPVAIVDVEKVLESMPEYAEKLENVPKRIEELEKAENEDTTWNRCGFRNIALQVGLLTNELNKVRRATAAVVENRNLKLVMNKKTDGLSDGDVLEFEQVEGEGDIKFVYEAKMDFTQAIIDRLREPAPQKNDQLKSEKKQDRPIIAVIDLNKAVNGFYRNRHESYDVTWSDEQRQKKLDDALEQINVSVAALSKKHDILAVVTANTGDCENLDQFHKRRKSQTLYHRNIDITNLVLTDMSKSK